MQFVLNYEEGGERSVLDGDPHAEIFLSEIAGALPFPSRHMSMESLYEYGSRAGVWRVLRLFRDRGLPLTVFGVAQALARNPPPRRPSCGTGTRSPGTAGAGCPTRTSRRTWSASTSPAPSRPSRG